MKINNKMPKTEKKQIYKRAKRIRNTFLNRSMFSALKYTLKHK